MESTRRFRPLWLLPLCLLVVSLFVCTALQAGTGILEIDSVPQGAKVFIDNIFVGTTPYTNPEIETGRHDIRIHYNDFFADKHWHVIVDSITPLRKTFYFTHLEKGRVIGPQDQGSVREYQGNVQIASVPTKVGVYVNEEWQGETPLAIKNLPEGIYKLKLEKENWSRTTDFPVVAGKTTKVIARIRENSIRVSAPGSREKQYIHMDVSFYLSEPSRDTISSLVVDVDRDTGRARGIFWSPILFHDQQNHPVRGQINRRSRSLRLTLYDTSGTVRGTVQLGGPLGRAAATDSFGEVDGYDAGFRVSGVVTFSGRLYRIISKARNMPLLPQYLIRTGSTPYDYHDFLLPEGEEKQDGLHPQ